jgi:hypothetical protein
LHAFTDQLLHLVQLRGRRLALCLAHHFATHAVVAYIERIVGADAAGLENIQQLADLLRRRAAIGTADDGRHTLQQICLVDDGLRRLRRRSRARVHLEEKIRHMIVGIDEAGRDDQTFRIYHIARLRRLGIADESDLSVADADIRAHARRTRTVDDGAAANQ